MWGRSRVPHYAERRQALSKKIQKVAVRQAGSYQRLLAIYDVPSVGKNKPKWQGKTEEKSITTNGARFYLSLSFLSLYIETFLF